MAWLGQERAHSALPILPAQLPAGEWALLQAVRNNLPGWMSPGLSERNAQG